MSKVRKFKQIENEKLLAFECPDCHRIFGLKAKLVEGNEANVHYFCPYCGEDRGLDG